MISNEHLEFFFLNDLASWVFSTLMLLDHLMCIILELSMLSNDHVCVRHSCRRPSYGCRRSRSRLCGRVCRKSRCAPSICSRKERHKCSSSTASSRSSSKKGTTTVPRLRSCRSVHLTWWQINSWWSHDLTMCSCLKGNEYINISNKDFFKIPDFFSDRLAGK